MSVENKELIAYVSGAAGARSEEILHEIESSAQLSAKVRLMRAVVGGPATIAAPVGWPRSDVESGAAAQFQGALRRLREGSDEAAWDLIEKYGPHIERVVRRRLDQRLRSRFDSQDFVQMVWASFFRHRSKIDQFGEPRDLVRYLSAVARNKVIDEARRGRTLKASLDRERDFYTESGSERRLHGGNTPSQYAMARECWSRLMSAEPERTQRIVQLRIRGLTFSEIARQLGLHERTVRRVIERLISKRTTTPLQH